MACSSLYEMQAEQSAKARLSRALLKTRASTACVSCRSKKVRCDVESGAPCTNCRLDDVECTITQTRCRRRARAVRVAAIKQSFREEQLSTAGSINVSVNPESSQTVEASPEVVLEVANGYLSVSGWSTYPLRLPDNAKTNPSAEYSMQDNLISLDPNETSVFASTSPPVLSELSLSPPDVFGYVGCSTVLPDYIEPLLTQISEDDVEYLARKGALCIPSEELRDALLRRYIDFVHPFLPIIDLSKFLSVIQTPESQDRKLSLLLFQAVMFSATTFVELELLVAAGFPTRRAAREIFYQRTKLLCEFDTESDTISYIQSLLLMTYWYETPDDQKDMCHWMGVAVSAVTKAGLHRASTYLNMDAQQRRLCKRIWWSCVMRDAIMALGMKRGAKIRSEDYDVPMLTLDDFELRELPSTLTCISSECRSARDIKAQLQLAIMCLQKAKLCVILRKVLSVRYTLSKGNQPSERGGMATNTTLVLLPLKDDVDRSQDNACERSLKAWIEDLPEEAAYKNSVGPASQHVESCLILHRAELRMHYLLTIITFYRPRLNSSIPVFGQSQQSEGAEIHRFAKTTIRSAAAEISEISNDLYSLDVFRFLPLTGSTVISTALVAHMLDSGSSDTDIQKAGLRHFRACYRFMQILRDTYAAADFVLVFIQAAVCRSYNCNGKGSRGLAEAIGLIPSISDPGNAGGASHIGQQQGEMAFDEHHWSSEWVATIDPLDDPQTPAPNRNNLNHRKEMPVDISENNLPHHEGGIFTSLPLFPSDNEWASLLDHRNDETSSLMAWMDDCLPQV